MNLITTDVAYRWYSQAGTPELTITTAHNPSEKTFTITAKQVGALFSMLSLPCLLFARHGYAPLSHALPVCPIPTISIVPVQLC